jgi:N-acetyl-S-(2-succino)cysteine monooxygenase
MTATGRRMHLAFSAHLSGAHPGAWRHPGTEDGSDVSNAAYRRLARIAEAGRFDMLFMADTPALRIDDLEAWSRYPLFTNVLEPLTALSAIAGGTEFLGLGGTATTSFNEPFNVARQFASLDHVSGGRAAWNVVTTANAYAAGNFGPGPLAAHAERYDRAREFVQLVKKFWNTWEDEAFVYDRGQGRLYDPAKLHPVIHHGRHFRIRGGLNIERTPQGHPVIIQAGASDSGKELAAETAEVVFGSARTIEAARAYYADLKGRMARYGREPEEICLLAGVPVIVAESAQEAEDKYQTLQELMHPIVARQRLAMDLETDLSDLPFDEPVPESRIPAKANLHTVYFNEIVRMIREERPPLLELARRYQRGSTTLRGTPGRVADTLEEWFTTGAADGFMLQLSVQPGGLEDFVRLVVPELQRRGLFRTEYAGRTLREHLGLRRPPHLPPAGRARAAQ